jgi:hypothetical protein
MNKTDYVTSNIDYVTSNIDYGNVLLENYNILNRINLATKIKKFPYNILRVNVTPTYKTILLEYIKDGSFYNGKKAPSYNGKNPNPKNPNPKNPNPKNPNPKNPNPPKKGGEPFTSETFIYFV